MTFDIRKDKSIKEESGVFDDDFFMEDEGTEAIDWHLSANDILLIAFKVALLSLGTLIMLFFETRNINVLNQKKEVVQKSLQTLTSEKSKLEKEIEAYAKLGNKSQEFMKKLGVIQALAKKRLLAISGLDHIQSVIPEKVWLNKISFKGTEFSIDGTALTNREVQSFVEALEETGAFNQVNIGKFSGDRSNRQDRNSKRREFTIVSILKE